MIEVIKEEEYETLVNFVDNQIEETNLPTNVPKVKNGMENIYIKMSSEDGSNKLQGFASLRVESISSGMIGNIMSIWVDPESRNTHPEYSSVLMENLIRISNNYLASNNGIENNCLFALKAITNEDFELYFKDFGFKKTSNGRKTNNGKFSMIRFFKELQ